METERIFDCRKDFVRAREERRFSREIEYGDGWYSSTLFTKSFRVVWIEDTGEFYVKDTISYKIYLTEKVTLNAWAAAKHMTSWKKAIRDGTPVEIYFPELCRIAKKGAPQPPPQALKNESELISNTPKGGCPDDDDLPF